MSGRRKKVVVLISGRGSNMEALLAAAQSPECPYEIAAVISNRPAAAGLKTASKAGVATAVIDHKEFETREAFEEVLYETILMFAADLVACAGFMRIMTEGFTRLLEGRMLNIHPSLLPCYKGLHTHERVLADGARIHGCTVHFVTADLDGGPIIMQGAVPVLSDDTPDTLAARVLKVEHKIYPRALALAATGAARLEDGKAVIDAGTDAAAFLTSPSL
jgi:phosphoribosylglycinamide formyltransferase-1